MQCSRCQSLLMEREELLTIDDGSRCIGCNFFFISRRIAVFGCQSRKASRNSMISLAKKCATWSSAITSRSAQGICEKGEKGHLVACSNEPHLVIVLFALGIERINNEIRMSFQPIICQKTIVNGQTATTVIVLSRKQ